MADDFERMWGDLVPVGRSARSGGYDRRSWTSVDAELRAWFAEQAAARGLRLEGDGFGNLVAWWDVGSGPAVLTGSHLDSVPDGGAYDGPLGVVSALAAVDVLRGRGVVPDRPIGVAVFAEEEGSRFGRACLGSRLATGLPWESVAGLRDADGVALGDVVPGENAPGGDAPDGGSTLLAGVGTFVELHVEQGLGLVDLGAAVGVASGIWPHGRWRFGLAGEANHAGTTRMEDRADPVLAYAVAALAADEQARLRGARATFGRVEVAPNGTNAVPSRVTAWLDARAPSVVALDDLVAAVEEQARDRAARDGTVLRVEAESVTGLVSFDAGLAAALASDHARGDRPVLATQAGHDAGVLQAAGIPSAMLFVRNPTGVSHSPVEHASVPDCLAGVDALADALAGMTGSAGMSGSTGSAGSAGSPG